ncbi:MAG TPA: MarR family transcriptional regulator [Candidatus Jeotgalibaca pullicola]|nr:MarR family transcriptional regulator [Candidatus Jeotgalibaca pullicola]
MESLMRYINRTARLSTLYRNEKLKEYGLTGIHHTYILNICRNPGISQEKLAKMIYVNKSSVTRQLARLELKGYVKRIPSTSDKRELLIYPTEKTNEVYPIVADLLNEWNDGILEDFSLEEKEILLRSMQKIMQKAKIMVDDLPN